MTDIKPGDRFGLLIVREVKRGAKGVHPHAACVCDCGRMRAVRHTRLRRQRVDRCASCALKAAWTTRPRMDRTERRLIAKESEYRTNAKGRGIVWGLSRDRFRVLIAAPCRYCGLGGAGGVDRANNSRGYVPDNSVPCCAQCNYAKRDQSVDEFLRWIERVHAHQGVLQRDRSLLLCLAQQSDGRGRDHAGEDL